MAISCGIYFLSKIVFWQADGYGMFLLERVMLAVAVSGISGVDVSILYLSSGKEHAQRTFGIYNSLTITGVMAAAGVYTLLIGSDYRAGRAFDRSSATALRSSSACCFAR